MPTTLTIRIENELKSRLDQLAEATHRSKSFLATEAIREFVTLNEWQVQEIKNAVKEADAGDFASNGRVKDIFSKWSVSAGYEILRVFHTSRKVPKRW